MPCCDTDEIRKLWAARQAALTCLETARHGTRDYLLASAAYDAADWAWKAAWLRMTEADRAAVAG